MMILSIVVTFILLFRLSVSEMPGCNFVTYNDEVGITRGKGESLGHWDQNKYLVVILPRPLPTVIKARRGFSTFLGFSPF